MLSVAWVGGRGRLAQAVPRFANEDRVGIRVEDAELDQDRGVFPVGVLVGDLHPRFRKPVLYGRNSLRVSELRTGVVGRQGYTKVQAPRKQVRSRSINCCPGSSGPQEGNQPPWPEARIDSSEPIDESACFRFQGHYEHSRHPSIIRTGCLFEGCRSPEMNDRNQADQWQLKTKTSSNLLAPRKKALKLNPLKCPS